MTTTTENDHAEENARAWMETIREQVATIKAAEALANPGQTYDDALDAITDLDAATHEWVTKRNYPRLGECDSTAAFLALVPR